MVNLPRSRTTTKQNQEGHVIPGKNGRDNSCLALYTFNMQTHFRLGRSSAWPLDASQFISLLCNVPASVWPLFAHPDDKELIPYHAFHSCGSSAGWKLLSS